MNLEIKVIYSSKKHRMIINGTMTGVYKKRNGAQMVYVTPDNKNIPNQVVPMKLLKRILKYADGVKTETIELENGIKIN